MKRVSNENNNKMNNYKIKTIKYISYK